MRFTLDRHVVNCFKGLTYDSTFNPGVNKFSAPNKSGKSRLIGSILWLLFDVDENGKKAHGRGCFEIKTLVNGNATHHEENSVTGYWKIDNDQTLKLQKTFNEKWSKPRGDDRELTGHNIVHCIDDKEVSKRDYNAKIKSIVSEDVFRMICDLRYFPSIPWETRRKNLQKVAGVENYADTLLDKYGLRGLIKSHSVDDYKVMIKAQRKKLNDGLVTLPAQIKENKRILKKDSDGIEIGRIQSKDNVSFAESEVKEAQQAIDNFSSGDRSDDTEKLKDLNNKLFLLQSQRSEDIATANSVLQEKREKLNKIGLDSQGFKNQINQKQNRLIEYKSEFEKAQLVEFDSNKHPCPHHSEECPFYGVEIPAHALENSESKFKIAVSNNMERIHTAAHKIKSEKEELESKVSELVEQKTRLESLSAPSILSEPIETQGIKDLKDQIKGIHNCKTEPDLMPPEYQKAVINAEQKLKEAREIDASVKQNEELRVRIKELGDKQKAAASEVTKIDSELDLIEQYNKSLADEVNEKVSELFELVTFRMYKKQMNGDYEQCCDILIDGIPYDTNQSNGQRMTAGKDISNTLSKHYNFWGPVIVDNAEAITESYELDGTQVIELYVSTDHKELTKEV